MARISKEKAGGQNVVAFLDMIAFAEIGPAMLAKSDDGYNVLVGSLPGNIKFFHSYADHPNVYDKATNSTAAGRYQILKTYWPYYKALLNLPDFSPLSQDLYAIQQFKERKALVLIQAGDFEAAVARVKNIWASMPGAGYNQREHKLDDLANAYVKAGGTIV